MPGDKPVKLAILWHMHQPDYREPQSNRMVMPWVRLHALKDYLDMPLLAARHDNVKVTFNLVPSLLDQIDLYLSGGSDTHLDLTRIKADELGEGQRLEILRTFFSANQTTMIEPHRRYRELFRKAKDNISGSVLQALFSSEEFRDLQVWSQLAWIDPSFRNEEPIRTLFAKERHFTEEDKQKLLDWQLTLMRRIVPTYKDLYERGRIDISFTPYYHPILPLLCDTDVARDAAPRIKLPEKRFVHPEDARRQVAMSASKFEECFGKKMVGMWPSEGSVSEEVASILLEAGVKWIATDEGILVNSLRKAGADSSKNPIHAVYDYGPGLKIFFRDHLLSDRVGFVYSGMDANKAVDDFISHIHDIRKHLSDQLDDAVISVILDGENAWEYFPDDGEEFLTEFYARLSEDPLIRTVTMSEAADTVKPRELKSLFAGSWINHNFRVWIGHPEDNAAWDLLSKVRNELVAFEQKNPGFDSDALARAWNQIYIAEGSDWCWWYGDEHRGQHNEEFDKAFRRHLIAVYEILGMEAPMDLLTPIFHGDAVAKAVMPDVLITPNVDGRLTHFYEWSGAGYYDCRRAGGTMHRVDRLITAIHFAYDYDYLYIRLDFDDKKSVELLKDMKCRVTLFSPATKLVDIELRKGSQVESEYLFAFEEILEIALKRSFVFDRGHGSLGFSVSLFDDDTEVESWPETDVIKLEVPDIGEELFWPE